ncbi:NAD(P)/FAD-dependent oxidoreductase [Microbulbifer sp.]|uniref:NAD(P)/FAD-dependent oxidoreductase n=1 Tax=Microbulbifer sp. TaxID=1908541 RepID=UPI003F2E3DA8
MSSATPSTKTVFLDIAVIGGGIAGLWLMQRLRSSGLSCALFEQEALGSGQTVASQGMIHGGVKYTLGGTLTGASEAIKEMPQVWRDCLEGEGQVDLSAAKILSDHFYLFSSGGSASKVGTFFASKLTRGRVRPVSGDERPEIFRHADFRGSVYQLVDLVLDVPSALEALSAPLRGQLKKIRPTARWQRDAGGNAVLFADAGGETLEVHAQRFILTAGLGNEKILEQLGCHAPQTQRRPLQQVMVRHHLPHRFYGHCLGAEKTPRLTISSHPLGDGSWVWYLGGSLAERGATLSPEKLIAEAQRELRELMPWVDLGDCQWATLPVDRAEPRQRNFARPDKAAALRTDNCANVIAAWPTKLTLAPNLADEVLTLLREDDIQPAGGDTGSLQALPAPRVAATPWEKAFA